MSESWKRLDWVNSKQNGMIGFAVIQIALNLGVPVLLASLLSSENLSYIANLDSELLNGIEIELLGSKLVNDIEIAILGSEVQFICFWIVFSKSMHSVPRFALVCFLLSLGVFTIGVGNSLGSGQQLDFTSTRWLGVATVFSIFYTPVFLLAYFFCPCIRPLASTREKLRLTIESLIGSMGLLGLSAFLLRALDFSELCTSETRMLFGNYDYIEHDVRLLLPIAVTSLYGPVVLLRVRPWKLVIFWVILSCFFAFLTSLDDGSSSMRFGRSFFLYAVPWMFYSAFAWNFARLGE